MSLSDISVKNPVFAWMLMLGLMFFGFIGYSRLGVSQMPDIDFPVISVGLTWEGAAPQVMESDVVDLVEDAVMSVQGVRSVASSIMQGSARITIEFDLDRNIDVAYQDVQAKVNQVQHHLPKDVDSPSISKTNSDDQPIIWLTMFSDTRSLRDLMSYAEDHVKDRFTTISGVGEIFLGGIVDRNLRIWVDAEKLFKYQLTVQDVIDAVTLGHQEVPAGRIETKDKEFDVRVMGEAVSPDEFAKILIPKRAGQAIFKPIYLKDVATIEDGLADIRRLSRTQGHIAVGLGIRKQRGSNEVAVARKVLERLEVVKKDLPKDLNITVRFNRTKFSEDSIRELTFTLVLSAIVTSLVCWMFLGAWSATLNILLAIPTSILGTFMCIYFFGFTLNTFTVLALSLAIGIVVDDAIMVLENIVRLREKGQGTVEAALNGANQITFAALASTIALIAIFLPVAFMSGIIGKFFFQFGVTISIAVALSLLEALTLAPMRCSQFLKVQARTSNFGMGVDSVFKRLAEGYKIALEKALRHPWIILIIANVLFFASLFFVSILRKEFVPSQDQSMFTVRLQTPIGSAMEFTDERMKKVEAFVSARPEVQGYFSVVGGFSGSVNSGMVFVTLKEIKDRPPLIKGGRHPKQTDIMSLFRKELNNIPDLKASMQDLSLSGFSAQRGFPIEFYIKGPDWKKLAECSDKIMVEMNKTGLMTDVDTDYLVNLPEIRVIPDRAKADERGVSINTVGTAINAMIGGQQIGKYTRDGKRYDIRIRLIPNQRSQAENINDLLVWNNRGEMVQLKDVVRIDKEPTPQTITRRNRERAITLFANVATGKSQTDALKSVTDIAKKVLPDGYGAVFSGSTQTFQDSFSSLYWALLLGVIVAYMVLASQFNSYLHPVAVLYALPFSVSGALITLWIFKQSLNVYSFIGLILLMGIVKKNSILLVDFTNQLRQEKRPVRQALLEACPIRLRPIIMTSLSTVAAALPPALALGPGAETRIPMAITIIGGVLVSTILTLFVVPCVYLLFSRLEHRAQTL
jgi:HAE1 family hydrophobic/amphiphilic exporter-1